MRELFSARELEEIRLADLEIDGRPRNRVPAQSIIRLPIEHRDSMDRKRFRNMGQQIMALYRGNEGADSMSETKVVVPDDLIDFVNDSVEAAQSISDDDIVIPIIQAALRWLSENPIVPEPEVPEAVKDLLWVLPADASIVEKENWKAHNEEILEAYRRGQRDK